MSLEPQDLNDAFYLGFYLVITPWLMGYAIGFVKRVIKLI